MPFILSSVLVWLFILFIQKKKDAIIREQEYTIAKQEALAEERTRIAAEIHDDLGSGLTTIRFLCQRLMMTGIQNSSKTKLEKISDQSERCIQNMSEIIWSMNAGFDNLEGFVAYVRRYIFEYFESYDIQVHFEANCMISNYNLGGSIRRNLFLCIKESLHNIIKHAKANNVYIRIIDDKQFLNVHINDDGIGNIDPNRSGNGLINLKNRMNDIQGRATVKFNGGCSVLLSLPIK